MEEGKHIHYTCPMHRDEVHEEPGKCPVCGMDLVPEDEVEESEM